MTDSENQTLPEVTPKKDYSGLTKAKKPKNIKLPEYTPLAWERQKGETGKQYDLFCKYRDMGPTRTVTECSKRHNISAQRLHYLRVTWHWEERVLQYDGYLTQVQTADYRDRLTSMNRKHINIANMFQLKVAKKLETMSPDDLTPPQMLEWFKVASELERKAMGQPTEITQQTTVVGGCVEHVHRKETPEEEDTRLLSILKQLKEAEMSRLPPAKDDKEFQTRVIDITGCNIKLEDADATDGRGEVVTQKATDSQTE